MGVEVGCVLPVTPVGLAETVEAGSGMGEMVTMGVSGEPASGVLAVVDAS